MQTDLRLLRPLAVAVLWMLVITGALSGQGATHPGFTVSTSAFSQGGVIPDRYTCSGADVSPALSWTNVPASAKALALIMDDPDAPSGTFTHWVLYNQDPEANALPEGVAQAAHLPGGALQGTNSAQRTGYNGPCPPPGKPHRYFFKLYALDSRLDLKPGASRNELERAMHGHVLAQAEYMGQYRR